MQEGVNVKVGSALLVCPGCGTSMNVSVLLDNVRTSASNTRLFVTFMNTAVEHECKGQEV